MGSSGTRIHVALRTKEQGVSNSVGRWNVTHGFDSQESSPTATTHIAKVSIPVGRWMNVQGKCSKMQAHITSSVVMDVAAFKVGHCIGCDRDATALQPKKRSA